MDKNLRYHGLVQAYSRTNRILYGSDCAVLVHQGTPGSPRGLSLIGKIQKSRYTRTLLTLEPATSLLKRSPWLIVCSA